MFPRGMARGFFNLVTHGRRQNVWAQIDGFKSLEDRGLKRLCSFRILPWSSNVYRAVSRHSRNSTSSKQGQSASTTSVTNRLSLCKIHHTAYDINFVGIDPDYTVHVRPDILAEKDGLMLEHGIKGMDKSKLWVPPNPEFRPDKSRIESRFMKFIRQCSWISHLLHVQQLKYPHESHQ